MRRVLSLVRLAACTGAMACLIALSGNPAGAAVIGFDDLLGNGTEQAPIASPYAGLIWNNFFALDTVLYTADLGPNGYANGLVSARNVAYSGYGTPAGFAAAQAFTLNSYAIGAAWNDGMTVTVQGWRAGVLFDTDSFTIPTTGSIQRQPGWTGIDMVSFTASGGASAGYRGMGEQFYLDNIRLNEIAIPEPAGLGVFMLLGGAGLLSRRGLARGWRAPHPPAAAPRYG